MMLFPKKVVGYVLPLYLPTNYGSSATNHNHPEVLWKSPSKSRKNLSAWPWEWIGRANQPATANHVLPSTYVYIIYIYILLIYVCVILIRILLWYTPVKILYISVVAISYRFSLGWAPYYGFPVFCSGVISLYSVLCAPLTKTQPLWPWLICICVIFINFYV